MQIDCVCRNAILRIVLAENIFGSLSIVLLHFHAMLLAFIRQSLCGLTIALVVSLLRALKAVASFAGFLSSKVAQSIIFLLSFV